MGDEDMGERLARVEERLRTVESDVTAGKRAVYGGAALLVAVLWNKLAAILGLGPQ